jgi:hypothetical protein
MGPMLCRRSPAHNFRSYIPIEQEPLLHRAHLQEQEGGSWCILPTPVEPNPLLRRVMSNLNTARGSYGPVRNAFQLDPTPITEIYVGGARMDWILDPYWIKSRGDQEGPNLGPHLALGFHRTLPAVVRRMR